MVLSSQRLDLFHLLIVSVFKVFIILILDLSSIAYSASVDPNIEWKVIETEHFKIIYDSQLHSVARLYAWQAERAHSFLEPIFKEHPSKTHVLISDSTDFANGSARFLPYPQITVFPVMPGDLDSLGHYDNWAAELMIHEYTHILAFEPSHGFYTPFRYLFGSLVHPTGLLLLGGMRGLPLKWKHDLPARVGCALLNMELKFAIWSSATNSIPKQLTVSTPAIYRPGHLGNAPTYSEPSCGIK